MTTTIQEIRGLRTLVQNTPETLLATPAGMQKWLASLAPTDQVGWSTTAGACPVATFLEANGFDAPMVGTTVITWRPDASCLAPRWMERFVKLVDRYEHQSIRASLAIALLHQATEQVR